MPTELSKDAFIGDWGDVTDAKASRSSKEEERQQAAIAAATQDTTDFIEEQRQIAYAKHMPKQKLKNY